MVSLALVLCATIVETRLARSGRGLAEPSETTAAGVGKVTAATQKGYMGDWGEEWKPGNHPGYKQTYSEHVFPGRAAVVASEDSQSDGKPSPGLTGANQGAYLKANADGTIER